MKAKKFDGFTLLEVVIALAIFSIAAISIYFLVNQSLDLVTYSNNKLLTIQEGIELTSKIINYNYNIDDLLLKNNLSKKIKIKVNIQPTISEKFKKINLLIKYNNVQTKFIFYQKM